MNRKLFQFICITLIILSLFGCTSNFSKPSHTNNSSDNITTIPNISEFSSTEFENYKSHFSPVKYAIYKHMGKEEIINIDDPRLIQLLNFLAYSSENVLDVWEQGYVEENTINSYLSSDFPMMEIYFSTNTESTGTSLSDTYKIVVCGDSYLLFLDPVIVNNGMEGIIAERYWPYGELAMKQNSKDSQLSFNSWGTGYWLDILKHSGF